MMELTPVAPEQKETLRNQMEKYLHDFSEWDGTDVDETGCYGYPYLDCYFTEPNRFAYFIRVDGKLAGFALVNDYPEVPGHNTDWCMSEFFVMRKYRGRGVGRQAAMAVFERHRGRWQLKRHPGNVASVRFWDSVVQAYTGGRYELIRGYPDREVDYFDGTPADVFYFDNGR